MIRKLPRYVLVELLSAFVLALVLMLLLVVAGLSVQLVYKGLAVTQLMSLIPYLAVFALPHALPAALLTSAVMSYGRLSADNEITAVRSSGIHLHVVVTPAVFFALVVTVLALHLNCNVLPRAYFNIDQLKLSAGQALAQSLIKAHGELTIPPFQIRADSVDDTKLTNVTILEYDGKYVRQMWSAREAEITTDPKSGALCVRLRDGHRRQFADRDGTRVQTLEFSDIYFPVRDPRAGLATPTEFKHMHMAMLLDERAKRIRSLRRVRERFADPKKVKKAARRELSTLDVDRNAMLAQHARILEDSQQTEALVSAARTKTETARLREREAQEKMSTARTGLAKAQREFKAVGKELTSDAQKRRAELREQIRRYEADIEKAQMRAEDAQADSADAAAHIAQQKKRLVKLDAQYQELGGRITSANDERSRIAARHDSAAAQLDMIEITTDTHQRVAMAFSCLTFMLVGIPLGLMVKRGNILVGFAVSFLVVLLIYYPLVLGGQVLIFDKYFPVSPSVWAANAVLALLGMALLACVFRR